MEKKNLKYAAGLIRTVGPHTGQSCAMIFTPGGDENQMQMRLTEDVAKATLFNTQEEAMQYAAHAVQQSGLTAIPKLIVVDAKTKKEVSTVELVAGFGMSRAIPKDDLPVEKI